MVIKPSNELKGRRVLKYPMPSSESLEYIKDCMNYILDKHNKNKIEMRYLDDYTAGSQPILNKVKNVRPEINHKIVENHASELVAFKVGYSGNVQYIQKSKKGCTGEVSENPFVSALNEVMVLDDKETKDREIREFQYICGTGYKMAFKTENEDIPFETEIVEPWNAFVVYDTGFGKRAWICGRRTKHPNFTEFWTIYTKNTVYQYTSKGTEVELKALYPNVLEVLPIIEYPLNRRRIGVVELVIDLLDAKNDAVSDRMDGMRQQVQSFMKFVNVDIDEESFTAMKELGAIKIYSTNERNADVDIVTNDFDQTSSQVTTEDIYQNLLQIAGVPDRQASAGGNTGQALIIGQGWANAESRANSDDSWFKKSEREYLKVIKAIFGVSNNIDVHLKDIDLNEVDVKFDRNKTDNILTKTQALMNLLQCGVAPRIALQICGLFGDPEEVYAQSKEYMDVKWITTEEVETNQEENGRKDFTDTKTEPSDKTEGGFTNTHE